MAMATFGHLREHSVGFSFFVFCFPYLTRRVGSSIHLFSFSLLLASSTGRFCGAAEEIPSLFMNGAM
jgi:hypothetical protein